MNRVLTGLFVALTALLLLSCGESDDGKNDDNGQTPAPAGMVRIPSGNQSFAMGSSDGIEDERPVHNVTFAHDFWIDTTETTQAKYVEIMTAAYPQFIAPDWNNPYGVGGNFPVYSVLWDDAVLYCNALSRRDGLDSVYGYASINGVPGNYAVLDSVTANLSRNGYRLPTEAEWEFAARGGDPHDFSWGVDYDPYPATASDSAEVTAHCVWTASSYDFGADTSAYGTQPVGRKIPNAFGLYDMSGNVYEWCHDWYGAYSGGAVTDPAGPDSGDWHCLRGGSWGSHALHLRSANRTLAVAGYQYYFIGFRAARNAP